MRPINADALINRIVFHSDLSFDQKEAFEDEINAEPTIELKRDKEKWIPCSERLPEDGEIVLVSDGIDYAVAFWRFDAEAWDDPLHGWLDSFEFKVKAWMPLPEPYGGDQDDKN